MQMWSGGPTTAPHTGDLLLRRYVFAVLDEKFLGVSVAGARAISMFDHCGPAITALVAAEDYHSISRSANRCAARCGDIQTLVMARAAGADWQEQAPQLCQPSGES